MENQQDRVADDIVRDIEALADRSTQSIRRVRRAYSQQLKRESAEDVLAVAMALVGRQRWVAYELVYHHPHGFDVIDIDVVEALGQGLDGWQAVDTFGRYISGPAWRLAKISDDDIRRWAGSSDRYWRRAALVSTLGLNLRAAGGTGDTRRTLDICALLANDRDDTIVKALSWALRELVIWDPDAVEAFLADHDDLLAPRIKREVRNKLTTGTKAGTPRAS